MLEMFIIIVRFSCTFREQTRERKQQIVLFLGDSASLGLLHAHVWRLCVPNVKNCNFTYAKNMSF